MTRGLAQALDPRALLPSLTAGAIATILTISTVVSLAALIFSGELRAFLPGGIGLMLFGAFAIGMVVAARSTLPVMVGMPQDTPAAILGLVGAGVAAAVRPADPAVLHATVLAAIALTSILSGLTFMLIGTFRWSAFVRYIPYPVVGGFLAGTGWLLATGALGVMVGRPIGLRDLPGIFGASDLIHWLPGAAFAVVLMVVLRRIRHYLVMPVALILATLAFYASLALAGVSLPQAFEGGWLLGPFPEGGLYRPLAPDGLARVQWPALLGQLDKIGTIVVLGVVSLLLNTSALEVVARRDLDLDRELRVAGVANLAAGLGGSPPGYQALGVSSLAHRLGAQSRLVGWITALSCGAALFFGATAIAYAPKPVLGGVLFLLGLSFLIEWLVDARKQLPAVDFLLVWAIVVVIAAIGFLEGIVAGVLVATVLFVISYSRIDAITNTFTGADHHSKVERPPLDRQLLREHGRRIHVMRLQGFLFFGTIQRILNHVRERTADRADPLAYLVLDLRRVTRVDSSAVFGIARLEQLARAEGFATVWTQVRDDIRLRFERAGLLGGAEGAFRVLPSLDHGLEWCENGLIAAHDARPAGPGETIAHQLARALGDAEAAGRVLARFERRDLAEGEYLMREGEPADAMYLVEDGQITIQLERGGHSIRLRSLRAGTTVGEMGLYLTAPRTASAVAARPSVVHRLTARALAEMERDDPSAATLLHRWIVRLLAERVADGNRAVEALVD